MNMSGVIVGTVIALIIGVIGIQIVDSVLTTAAFTGLLATVTDNIPVLMGVSLLVLAVAWAAGQ